MPSARTVWSGRSNGGSTGSSQTDTSTGSPPDRILLDWASHAVSDSHAFLRDSRHIGLYVPPWRGWRHGLGVVPERHAHAVSREQYGARVVFSRRVYEARPGLPVRRAGPALRTRRRAVLVLPQWNAGPDGHVGLCRLLNRFGMSALRLTLPYHDARRPPELNRADYIVSANVGRTVQACRQAVMDARRAIGWLTRQGYDRIGILGTSLGSCLSLLTAAHEPRVHVQALNHISPYFADVVWRGLSTTHVRAGLEGSLSSSTVSGRCGCRSARRSISIGSGTRRRCSSTQGTT